MNPKLEARQALEKGWQKSLNFSGKARRQLRASTGKKSTTPESAPEVDYNSISVDVGCSGNPGIVEYKGINTKTGEIIFYQGTISKGTNNLGEFLAIVHGLAYFKKIGSNTNYLYRFSHRIKLDS